MPQIRHLLFLAAFAPLSIFAQSSVWKVTKEDQTLYLGGTCHILRSTDFPLPEEFDVAYSEADTLYFEINPAELEDPAFAMKLMAQSVYRDGRTLKSVLSEEAYTLLAEKGKEANISIDVIQNTKPGMAVMMVTLQKLAVVGVSQEGVDMHYAKRGYTDGKAIGALESSDFQIDLLTNLGEGIESEFVLFSLKDLDQIERLFGEIITTWRTGDLEKLEQVFVQDMRAYPSVYAKLLSDRNARWLPQIETMLTTPEIEFVLVGAAHMAGPDGVIALLESKGYQVEQLTVKE